MPKSVQITAVANVNWMFTIQELDQFLIQELDQEFRPFFKWEYYNDLFGTTEKILC